MRVPVHKIIGTYHVRHVLYAVVVLPLGAQDLQVPEGEGAAYTYMCLYIL